MKNNIKQLPDLGLSAKLLKISVQLEDVKEDTIFGFSIKKALKEGRIKSVIKMIWEQSHDNRKVISQIVGEITLKDIEEIMLPTETGAMAE